MLIAATPNYGVSEARKMVQNSFSPAKHVEIDCFLRASPFALVSMDWQKLSLLPSCRALTNERIIQSITSRPTKVDPTTVDRDFLLFINPQAGNASFQ